VEGALNNPPLHGVFATLPEALRAAGRQFSDREAYVDGDQRLTFGEWLDAAEKVARLMSEVGVGKGDVVALMLPPSIDYAVAFAAGALLGAVVTGLNVRLGHREVEAILRQCRPALIWRDETLGLPAVPSGFATMDRTTLAAWAVSDRGGPVPSPADIELTPTDPAVIIWTSGTTGLPKGAWFDHRALSAAVSTAGVMSEAFDRRLVSTPFAHAGYMAKLWEQAAWATTLVISPTPWRASDMLRLMAQERITVAGGVPTQWAKLLEEPGIDSCDLSALRLCVAATAPAPPELVESVTRTLRCPLVVRYAMTESPSITGTEPGDPPETLYRTVGRPQAGVDVRIADESGHPVHPGQVGQVQIRSSCAMTGYWNEPQLSAQAWTDDGWMRSGDLGRIDEDGNLVLAGRATDMYI
jgi:acyl-CoA synthetase (AMP-forming)/AMP-acid ligase II